MAVQQEIKSQLAKLLATEDIIVEHKQVPTAQFNVHTRVLILPLWEKASHDVYDMLVGHEVGHALFTPDEDWTEKVQVPQQIVNVVEDARIEKLMKRKYMGIAKSFYRGYTELHEQDFFELNGEDITSFNLADRANLYFKLGSILPISFSTTEKPIIDLIYDCETFDDTLSAAEALYTFCKQEQKKQEQNEKGEEGAQQGILGDSESFGIGDSGSDTDLQPSVPDADSGSPVEDRGDITNSTSGVDDSDITVETADSLDQKIRDLVNSNGTENTYVSIPKLNLETVIAKNEKVHKIIDDSFTIQQEEYDARAKEIGFDTSNIFYDADSSFVEFKRDAQKEVNYLVKEFECRKSASAYARSATNRTGVLDTTKLSTYRFNEDIFRRVTVLPDGKNHGLVFVLDWSGSMQYVLQDTLKQLYNLTWFCRKVQIPFEVYAFTNEFLNPFMDRRENVEVLKQHYEKKEGLLRVEEEFCLMNILTSQTNAKILEKQMINMWRIALCFKDYQNYTCPNKLSLSGTPLNEALIALHQILPKFQKDNKVEKVQCIVLTDGEAHQIPHHVMVKRSWHEDDQAFLGCRNIHPGRTFLRDRKIGKTYGIGYAYHEFTEVLLTNLKDNFPTINLIGIRVLANRDANRFIKNYTSSYLEQERLQKEWRRSKSLTLTNCGYDAYFGMSSTTLAQDAEFEVNDDATKAQIKRAFAKSLKVKKLNKKVLSEFISLVA
jgi:hypothetical protein